MWYMYQDIMSGVNESEAFLKSTSIEITIKGYEV